MENANELRHLLSADKREDYDFTTYIKSNEAAADFVLDRYLILNFMRKVPLYLPMNPGDFYSAVSFYPG